MNNILSNSKGSGITPGTLHLFTIAATLARIARQRLLHVKKTAPWADLFTTVWDNLAALSPP